MKRQLDRRWIYVVGGLTEIEMIVGMYDFVLPVLLAEYLQYAIRHHLIDVHVAGSTGAALDHIDTEVVVMQSFADLRGCLTNRIDDIAFEQFHLEVGESCRFFYSGERGDERGEFVQLDSADGEVLDRTQRLDSVEGTGGYHLSRPLHDPPCRRHPGRRHVGAT